MDGRSTHTRCLLGGHRQGLRYCSGLAASRSLIAVRAHGIKTRTSAAVSSRPGLSAVKSQSAIFAVISVI